MSIKENFWTQKILQPQIRALLVADYFWKSNNLTTASLVKDPDSAERPKTGYRHAALRQETGSEVNKQTKINQPKTDVIAKRVFL